MLAFIHVHVMYACVKVTSLNMCTCRVHGGGGGGGGGGGSKHNYC